MKKHGPCARYVTDKLRSYGAAMKDLGIGDRHETGLWLNNRAENSHLAFGRREQAMLRFRRMRSLQKFASVHALVTYHFNLERSLSSRPLFKTNRAASLAEWRGLCAGSGDSTPALAERSSNWSDTIVDWLSRDRQRNLSIAQEARPIFTGMRVSADRTPKVASPKKRNGPPRCGAAHGKASTNPYCGYSIVISRNSLVNASAGSKGVIS